MQSTTNFGLKKPEANEYYNVDDFNSNADTIDEELKKAQDAAGRHAARHATAGEDPITPESIGAAELGEDGKILPDQLPEMDFAASSHASQHAADGEDPITLESIGAAPAGYGWGEQSLAVVSDADSYAGNGRFVSSTNVPTAQSWIVDQKQYSTGRKEQTAYRTGSSTPEIAVRKYTTELGWSSWERSLTTGNMASLGCAQIQTGTYTGTGTYGSSNKSSLTFNFTPKVVIIYKLGDTFGGSACFTYGETTVTVAGGLAITPSWATNSLAWYSTSAIDQFNYSGAKYGWIALG